MPPHFHRRCRLTSTDGRSEPSLVLPSLTKDDLFNGTADLEDLLCKTDDDLFSDTALRTSFAKQKDPTSLAQQEYRP
jgi:hypothetical protein